MSMTDGQIYRCLNRDCGCEIQVTKPSIEAKANPRCCCGAEMKKPYQKPLARAVGANSEVPVRLKTERNQR
jgi:hypothetical protein